jgi:hypothetical protein
MGRPKGSKNKPKNVEVEVETKQEEVKVVASEEPKKERKPRITKRVKNEEEDDGNTIVDEGAAQARKNLDDRTLDPFAMLTLEKFECEFVALTERLTPVEENSEIKNGRYSSSYYPIKNCNYTVWPVLAYINVDVDALRTKGYVDNQNTDVVAGQGFATLDYVEDAITSVMAAARIEISTEIGTSIDTAELDGGDF